MGQNFPIVAAAQSHGVGAVLTHAHAVTVSLHVKNEDAVVVVQREIRAAQGEHLPQAQLSGGVEEWFTNVQRSAAGAVTDLTVGGETISGNQLRTILGLRSACFTMTFEGDAVTFSVTGYGHGVGMSQYGANVLAADGMNYREILSWYYTDTTVGTYTPA